MRNSIAYMMIFRNHVRFFVRNQIAARRFDDYEESAA
jgi:hypothetical protein